MPQVRFAIWQRDIPTMIGSSGSMVKKLEKETNTKINIDRESGTNNPDWSSRMRSVEVKGTKKDLVKALIEITTTITPENDAPFLQIQLLLEDELVTPTGFLMKRPKDGQLNKKVDRLNGEVSARCKVISVAQLGRTGIEVLSLSEEEFEEALLKVVDVLLNEESQGQDVSDRQSIIKISKKSIDEQMEEITKETTIAFLIPLNKTSSLIGPKGVTINKMQKDHDVKLQVESQHSAYTSLGRTVLIHGSIMNIGECMAAITAQIFKDESEEARVVILLPPGVAKFIIGRSGEAIKRVEKESECTLDIEGANGRTGGGLEYCRITGNMETIIKGVQGVVARVSMHLDMNGLTSEEAYPKGLDFSWLPSTGKKSGPWYSDKSGGFGSAGSSGWRTSGVRDGKVFPSQSREGSGLGIRQGSSLASTGWSTSVIPSSGTSPSVGSGTRNVFAGASTSGGGWGAANLWRDNKRGSRRTPWGR